MSQPTEQRPPQVTLASGIVMFASVVVVLTAYDRVTSLGSLDTQQTIRDVLADAPFSSLGIDVNGASELLRISCMVAAAAACATAILGWYVRKPDRSARLALSLFAVVVFVSGFPAGGLAGSFVAAGTAMLWMQPGREWFATGRWTPPPPAPDKDARGSGAQGRTPTGQGGAEPPGWPSTPPPATRPFGDPPPSPQANPYGQPYPPTGPHAVQPVPGAAPSAHQQRQLLHTRPGAMVAAFVITVVTAGGLLTMSLMWFAIAGLSPEFLMSVLEEQQPQLVEDGLTMSELRGMVFALAGGAFVWGGVALVLAGFAMARRDWARRGLMVSAAFSAGGCFALVLSAPLVVVPAMAAVATVVCLRRVEVRRWFRLDAR